MEILEKLNREGMNVKASKLLYDYFASKRPFEKVDNNSAFSLTVRSVVENPQPNLSGEKRPKEGSNPRLNQSVVS